jgi:very-short-patch-repair endonuclease
VIELDGGVHDAPFYDLAGQQAREAWLRAEGYRVLRFPNHEVENNPNAVFERIAAGLRGG